MNAQDAKDIVFPSEDAASCPNETYARLRESRPVHNVPGTNDYVVTRHEDIMFVVQHPDLFSSVTYALEDGARRQALVSDLEGRQSPEVIATFQGSDPPVHTWKRRLAAAHFKPAEVRAHEDTIRDVARDLLQQFVNDGSVEFISAFARPLGTMVSFMLLGLPLEDAELARDWSRYEGQATPYHDQDRQDEIAHHVRKMHAYINGVIAERIAEPREDVVSEFVASHGERNGVELGGKHAAMDLFSILLGGVGTSSHMLGNVMLHLVEHPQWMNRARHEEDVLRHAVEESLRLESPVQWTPRMAVKNTEINGVEVPAGAQILLLWGAGNRDPERFEDAERYDPGRGDSHQHLAFGHGIHFCLGAPLARLEAQIGMQVILETLESIRLVDREDAVVRADSWVFRGLEQLHLEFSVSAG